MKTTNENMTQATNNSGQKIAIAITTTIACLGLTAGIGYAYGIPLGFVTGLSVAFAIVAYLGKWLHTDNEPGGWIPAAMTCGIAGMLGIMWVIAGVAKFQGAY